MNIERSKPPESDPSHRRDRTEPNTEEFEKYKRVEKVREVDPEEARKRRQQYQVDKDKAPRREQKTEERQNLESPYNTYRSQPRRAQTGLPPADGDDFSSVDRGTRRQYNLPQSPPEQRREDLPRSPDFWRKDPNNPHRRQADSRDPSQGKTTQSRGSEEPSDKKKKSAVQGSNDPDKSGKKVSGKSGLASTETEEVETSSVQEKPKKKGTSSIFFLDNDEDTKPSKKATKELSEKPTSIFDTPQKKGGTKGKFLVEDEDLIHPGKDEKPKQKSKEALAQKAKQTIPDQKQDKQGIFSGISEKPDADLTKTSGKKKDKASDHSSKELDESSESALVSVGRAASGGSDSQQQKKDDSDSTVNTGQIQNIPPAIHTAAAAAAAPLTTYMSPEIAALFTHMVGSMMVMVREGITTTEVSLTSPQFQSSVFFGATIALDKYSTAPDAFNVRVMGSQEAVNLCNANSDELFGAFQKADFGFKVNRLDTSLDTHGGTFKRKPKVGGDAGGSMGQGQ